MHVMRGRTRCMRPPRGLDFCRGRVGMAFLDEFEPYDKMIALRRKYLTAKSYVYKNQLNAYLKSHLCPQLPSEI